jgi:hypothetical protein
MNAEPILPRKWALRASDQRVIFIKGNRESARHVIMKAMLWGLYLPTYPTLTIEIRIGDRYKPDLVAFDPNPNIYQAQEKPLFWGESGVVAEDKVYSIVRRYPNTHFALAKWEMNLKPVEKMVRDAMSQVKRTAPFDILRFPSDSVDRFIDAEGKVNVTHNDVEWIRLQP